MQNGLILTGLFFTVLSYSTTGAQTIRVDGSSTVFPIGEAVAEEFQIEKSKKRSPIRVTVGLSGTGGGFKKFLQQEIDVAQASRPISQAERDEAKKLKIEFIELPVAYDGLTVVVHKDFPLSQITLEDLGKVWQSESKIKQWSDLSAKLPKEKIKLYGPGTDSGTFDYFTEVVNGKSGLIRRDFSPSEDDNMLVRGVVGDRYAMAYFGFAYFEKNKDKLKALAVQNSKTKKFVMPSVESITNESYAPLSRPLYIYVNSKSAQKPEVREFVEYYLNILPEIVRPTGYVALETSRYDKVKSDWNKWLATIVAPDAKP